MGAAKIERQNEEPQADPNVAWKLLLKQKCRAGIPTDVSQLVWVVCRKGPFQRDRPLKFGWAVSNGRYQSRRVKLTTFKLGQEYYLYIR